MNNVALAYPKNQNDIWDDKSTLAEIKLLFAPHLTQSEFSYFIQVGKNTGLNPFMRELWAVKYGRNPAQIFVGRDGYRKSAQAHPAYEYHQVNAVYCGDEFTIINDEIYHQSNPFAQNQKLTGAYCKVKRKNAEHYTYVTVKFDEYNLKQGLWVTKPETMIKKVAEAQALRAAFQDVLGGTYDDAEMPCEPEVKVINCDNNLTQTQRLHSILSNKEVKTDITLHDQIPQLLSDLKFNSERTKRMLEHYKVQSINELTNEQAKKCIENLIKLKEDK